MAEPPSETARFYDAPPIVEAVIELRFRDKLGLSGLKKLSRKLATAYPNEAQQIVRGAHVNFETKDVAFVDEAQQIRRSTSDEVEIIVLKPDGFSFSRLAPYLGWDSFQAHVVRDIRLLLKGAKRNVQRIGIRYINRVDIPMCEGKAAHEDYLNVYVKVPSSIETIGPHNLAFETVLDQHKLIIQSGMTEAIAPDTCAFYLDIDLIAVEDVPQDLDGVIRHLRKMRTLKNQVFETLITDKARELFNHA
jgi:uncharacterized protein (TIGR04255 family)